jgi:hypothetical protein
LTDRLLGSVVEVRMTDVLAPVLVPYTRFLEVRARRLDIGSELADSNGQCPTNLRVSPEPIADNERPCAAVRVFAVDPASGVQHS